LRSSESAAALRNGSVWFLTGTCIALRSDSHSLFFSSFAGKRHLSALAPLSGPQFDKTALHWRRRRQSEVHAWIVVTE
jgi:hypothetical protein